MGVYVGEVVATSVASSVLDVVVCAVVDVVAGAIACAGAEAAAEDTDESSSRLLAFCAGSCIPSRLLTSTLLFCKGRDCTAFAFDSNGRYAALALAI